jgi:ribonucleoside-diphosphate reductase alpha chain
MAARYAEYFPQFIKRGVDAELLDDKLLQFDLASGRRAGRERDLQFDYLGLQTLYDRYFLHVDGTASKCRRPSSCAWPWAWR